MSKQRSRHAARLFGIDASRAVVGWRTGTEGYAFHLIRELIPLAEARGHRLRLYFNQAPPPDLFADAAHVETVVIHDLDLELLRYHREEGSVQNWKDRRRDLYRVVYREGDESLDA